jgi:hypothetical protein
MLVTKSVEKRNPINLVELVVRVVNVEPRKKN